MSNLSYKCVALDGITDPSRVKRDGDYYWVCLGALNIFNSEGHFYEYEASLPAFDDSTKFKRKMFGGNLYGEDNHPVWEGWMTEEQFLLRNEDIDTDRIACHIREMEFVPTNQTCNGLPVWEIWGWVKPDKMRGEYLKAALDNPHQNVCFSIRCWVREKWVSGKKFLMIDEVITFDWVIEPGVSKANKFYAEAGYEISNDRFMARESVSIGLTSNLAERVLECETKEVTSGRKLATESYVSRRIRDICGTTPGVKVKSSGVLATDW
jgi:hypothetical protein